MEHGIENVMLQMIGKKTESNQEVGIFPKPKKVGIDRDQKKNIDEQGIMEKTSVTPVGPNIISKSNGVLNEEGLRRLSGWSGEFKAATTKKVMEKLEAFHQAMNGMVSNSESSPDKHKAEMQSMENANEMYEELVGEVRSFVDGTRKWTTFFHKHKKEEKALLPAMSSLLIQLYSLGNAFEYRNSLSYDYLIENNLSKARIGDILTGQGALSVQGNRVSTREQSGQLDRTAMQMKKWNETETETDRKQELKSRRLPLPGDRNAVEELLHISKMLEDMELQTQTDVEREDIRTEFFDVTKMISLLLQNPDLMFESSVNERTQPKSGHEERDLAWTAEFYRMTAGMTIEEASKKIDEVRRERAEIADENSTAKEGVLSQVLIDEKQNRVLRTIKGNNMDSREQKKRNNFNYDEAMSRLGEITGLGSQAGARATYYKDTNGKLQYGTNMDKAAGIQARDVKLSFGDTQMDSRMKQGRYNIFGYETKEQLEKNAGLIISSFKMQIIDYISFHQDRHNENYFIDLDAAKPQDAFVGIDNDNVFGVGTDSTRNARAVSYQKHAKEEKLFKGYKGVTSTLKGFECIPKETAEQIAKLDEKKIGEAMKPYLDKAARLGLMRRIHSLKKYVSENAIIVNIYTPKGMEEFGKATAGSIVKAVMDLNAGSLLGKGENASARMAPGILMRTLMMQYLYPGSVKDKYSTEFEYMTGQETVQEYFDEKNKSVRDKKFWDTFVSLIRIAGMEEDKEYLELKKKFESGKLKII